MSKDNFIRGVGEVDDKILDRYEKVEEKISQRNKKNKYFIRWATVAACIALILGAIPMAVWISKRNTYEPPAYENALYSAEEIARLLSGKDSLSTNKYVELYVPNPAYLYIGEIPDDEYLPVYRLNDIQIEIDRPEFENFLSEVMPKISEALGTEIPEYQFEENSSKYTDSISISPDAGKYRIHAFQNNSTQQFTLSSSSSVDIQETITLNGETVKIDQRQSDDEIIESLSGIKEKLFDIFGVSFSDALVYRVYDSSGKYGVWWIDVKFYNKGVESSGFSSSSDYIKIHFINCKNYSDAIVSDSFLSRASISYVKYRFDPKLEYQVIGEARKISLEEAEGLLYNGYVFGAHSCARCMEAQEKIDFEGYDFVGFTYMRGNNPDGKNFAESVPFYTFYKYIGISSNGNLIYAKAYVPAIEISGLKEYFESQKAYHQFFSID